MKIYKTQSEVEKDIKNGVLAINDDVTFECSISINASIYAYNINAHNINANNIYANNINAHNIDAYNINADDINAHNIDAYNIDAGNIDAGNINAGDINANDIDAGNINAGDIDANNILYYAFCGVYNSIKCLSIKAKRDNHSEPICLDGKLEIKEQEVEELTMEQICKELGREVKIKK